MYQTEAQEPEIYHYQATVAQAREDPPVTTVLKSADPQLRDSAAGAAQSLLATLDQVARKKRGVEDTMALLMREIHAARQKRIRRILGTIALVIVVIGLVTLHIQAGGFGWMLFKLFGALWVADKAVGVRRNAARTLGEAGDPRAVGVLAIALRDGDAMVRRGAEEALQKLLPRVRAEDAAYIPEKPMQALLSLLETGNDPLRIALLRALEQIGDERAIPHVNSLIVFGSPPVRRQAEQCQPYLEERARRARESATLLRASSAAAVITDPDHLLRPSYPSAPQTPKEHLLRPVQSQPGDG